MPTKEFTNEKFNEQHAHSIYILKEMGIDLDQYPHIKLASRADYSASLDKHSYNILSGVIEHRKDIAFALLGVKRKDFTRTRRSGRWTVKYLDDFFDDEKMVMADDLEDMSENDVRRYLDASEKRYKDRQRFANFKNVQQFVDEYNLDPLSLAYAGLRPLQEKWGLPKGILAELAKKGITTYADVLDIDVDGRNPYDLSLTGTNTLISQAGYNDIVLLKDFKLFPYERVVKKINKGHALVKRENPKGYEERGLKQIIIDESQKFQKITSVVAEKSNKEIEQPVTIFVAKPWVPIEKKHRAQFVDNHIGETIRQAGRVAEFLLPLQDIESTPFLRIGQSHEFIQSLPKRESQDGTPANLTLGDLAVQSDADLVRSFGFNKEEIEHTHRVLTAYGLRNGMRDDGHKAYDDFIDDMIAQDKSYDVHGAAIANRQKNNRQKYGL